MKSIKPPTVGTVTPSLLLAAVLLVVSPWAVTGQSAQQVLETAMERHAERMQGVENYTVVQTVNGSETTMYFERVESEGDQPRFRPITTGEYARMAADESMAGGSESAMMAADPAALFDELAPRAELDGTEAVDGREAYVITIRDMSGIDLGQQTEAGPAMRFQPVSLTLWIDTDRYVALRSSLRGTMQGPQGGSEMTFDARMSDYREVDGMLYPFRTEVAMEGMGGAVSEEQQEMRRAMEQMQERLENMPAEQRAMVEEMMKERMPNLEAMTGAGGGGMTTEVTELRVNEGPPEEMREAAAQQERMAEARERRAAEREAEREAERRRERDVRRPREQAPVDPSEHEMRYAEYQGIYESTGERSTTFFVTEMCGSGNLAIGSMRGDVAPWVFDEVAEGEFRAPPISPAGPGMHVRFTTGPGGQPAFDVLTEEMAEFGQFQLSGELPERWEQCMQPIR